MPAWDVVVFVRNGNDVGWIELEVVPEGVEMSEPSRLEKPKPSIKPKQPDFIPTVELRVKANGELLTTTRIEANEKLLTNEDEVNLVWGDSIQLEVEAIYPDGSKRDVTRDSKTAYVSQSPWNLTVSDTGLVRAESDHMFGHLVEDELKYGLGSIIILYGAPGDKDRGITMMSFNIEEESRR